MIFLTVSNPVQLMIALLTVTINLNKIRTIVRAELIAPVCLKLKLIEKLHFFLIQETALV